MCKWAAQRLGAYLLVARPEEALGAFQSMIRAAPDDPAGWEGSLIVVSHSSLLQL
jgi:hypothetical protein